MTREPCEKCASAERIRDAIRLAAPKIAEEAKRAVLAALNRTPQ